MYESRILILNEAIKMHEKVACMIALTRAFLR